MRLAKIVSATPTVSDAELISLRMNTRPTPKRRDVPATAPVVRMISVVGRVVKFRVKDSASEMRGLPFGASAANLYSFVGPSAPNDPEGISFRGSDHTRQDANYFSQQCRQRSDGVAQCLLGQQWRRNQHRRACRSASPCKAARLWRGLEEMGGLSARIIHHGDTEGTEKNRKDQ